MDKLIPYTDLSPSPLNAFVRGEIDDNSAEIDELANSIKEHGLIQPLVVVETPGGPTPYQIVTGERRWRATRTLGDNAPLLPCHVRPPLEKLEQLLIMGAENMQRQNMPPVQEGRYFQTLMEHGLDHKDIARRTGKSVWYIKSRLDLLNLSKGAQVSIDTGRLPLSSAEHIRELPHEVQDQVAFKMTGRTSNEIIKVVNLIKHRMAPQETPRISKKNGNGTASRRPVSPEAQLKDNQKLLAQMWAQIRQDGMLLKKCADALAGYGDDIAAEAFDRAYQIKNAAKRGVHDS